MAYDWPGNVRELENIVERSLILSSGATLSVERLPGANRVRPMQGAAPVHETAADIRTLEQVERDHILAVCERCGWRINGAGNAAERLGINPNTLRSRMLKLGILRPATSHAGRSRSRRPLP
jgi:DNA-binding NtrC family response regulator